MPRLATALALLTGSLLVGALASPAAAHDAPLTCADTGPTPPVGLCAALSRTPRAPADHPQVARTVATWQRLYAPFLAMTDRDTALAVLAPDAQLGGKPIAPSAYICAGAPPTVYVPWSLVDLVASGAYPDDFMAFVLGHELGHRINDITPDGCELQTFQRPGGGRLEEELADKRAAFFIAAAGFSTRRIASEDLVTRFLAAEYDVRPQDSASRKHMLLDALGQFDAWEHLYQLSLALALSTTGHAPARLLAWADEAITRGGVPLPEVKLARALALMAAAAPHAPWRDRVRAPGLAGELRCGAIFPAHSAFAVAPPARRVRAAGLGFEQAEQLLRQARRLLEEARDWGAPPLAVASAQACVSFYLGEPSDARRFHQAAARLAPRRAPRPVTQALADTAGLIELLAFLQTDPAPASTDAPASAAWAARVRAAASRFGAAHDVLTYVAALQRYPDPAPPAAPPRDAPQCRNADAARVAAAAVPARPQVPGDLGACPAGWTLAHTVPDLAAPGVTPASAGVTTCLPPAGQPAARLSHVRLPETTSPAMAEVDTTLLSLAAPPKPLASLDAWACLCPALTPRGTSDDGLVAWAATCPAQPFRGALLFATAKGRVQRLVVTGR